MLTFKMMMIVTTALDYFEKKNMYVWYKLECLVLRKY